VIPSRRVSTSAQIDRLVWDGPYAGSFEPDGPIATQGRDRAPPPPVLAARFVLGFSAGTDHATALDELIEVARDVRARQAPNEPEPMIVAQGGAYRHREPSGTYRNEIGGQVVVIDTLRSPRVRFERQMIELAETIARWFGQGIVVLELQQDGATQVVHAVSP
jgi:hypothetical protein